MKRILLSLLVLFFLAGCYRAPDKIEPQVNFSVQDKYLRSLPSTFSPLTPQERNEPWGQEYLIAQKFAKHLDLYRAITTFKRAEFLLPAGHQTRLKEIRYQILLSYYLGKRYEEVTQEFTHSPLYTATTTFPAYQDLLIIMYESYLEVGDEEKAEYILSVIQHHHPETAKKLELSTAIIEGNLDAIRMTEREDPSKTYLTELLANYHAKKKSVGKAQTLNAVLPGAGYLYVGQKQSALTSFLLNGLFIWAAVHFYTHGHIAAGIVTTSFETGWYFGGIYGAGESAKLYNERLYEEHAYPPLNRNGLFPVLMLKYGF
ncbi:MAG: tetratricopeptide repeat protein [Candidatus Neptunochlamydia sp.]|nr:tetratricopeptide repeat protein [Candidatus Neptunochlamydia sp.]